MPHTGTDLPDGLESVLHSPWLARKDCDWWVDRLYTDIAADLDATVIRTAISRTAIDVNRDPSGASLYPGQVTTELCPTTTFDGEPLYKAAHLPDEKILAQRRSAWFDPYHSALSSELARLKACHPHVVLYDAHSIRSRVSRLFEGVLPHFNIGTYSGKSCDATLTRAVEAECAIAGFSQVTDGRFKGGWTTRHYGMPGKGVHAIQMELACRSYMDEPGEPLTSDNWPPTFDERRAEPLRRILRQILSTVRSFARRGP
jgi:formiminoglutamase